MKKFLIVLINIFLICLVLYLFEFTIYKNEINKIPANVVNVHRDAPFSQELISFQSILDNYKIYFDGTDNVFKGRLPDGLEFSEKEPITIFGCSFAHGQYLGKEQTLSYKLSQALKRPVYNRSVVGGGLQHMYYQTTQPFFYNDVPKSNDVIYIFINDHYRRMLVTSFDILDNRFLIHYSYKDNEFIMENYDNKIMNLIKNTYIYKYLNHKYVEYYLKNQKNKEALTDLVTKYFIESRKNLENHWGKKINFRVILYNDKDIMYKDTLTQKLLENDFQVLNTNNYISEEDLNSGKYIMLDNGHPKEESWTLFTPIIIKDLDL